MRLNRHTAIAPLIALATAFATDSRAQWNGRMRDSAGVTVVENTEQGMWGGSQKWTLTPDLRIGTLDGDPAYEFGQVGWIGVASDGRIFVLDNQAQHIQVYSSDGTYRQTFAGPGSGPGELGQGAVFVLVGVGDTVLVPDLANQRINRYAPDGTSLGSAPIDMQRGLPLLFRATPDGRVAVQVRPLSLPDRPAPDTMDVILELAPDGNVRDTLMRFPSGRSFDFSGGQPTIKLYSPEPVWEVRSDGTVLFGVNDRYRIGVYDDGVLERVITKPFERRRVTDRDKEAVFQFMEDAARDAGAPPGQLAMLRQIVQFGEYFPAFNGIQSGPDGTIWVQHLQSAAELSDEQMETYNLVEDSGAPDWDVFDAQGRFLGVVTMPERFAPRVIREGEIYGVWRDDLDVQYVMRLTIERDGR